jgi:hypothetical protein
VPRISWFYGILILMHWSEAGHMTPHFHVEYGNHRASVDVDGALLAGSLPPRCQRLVREWARLHRDELLANWEHGRNNEPFEPIDPLA